MATLDSGLLLVRHDWCQNVSALSIGFAITEAHALVAGEE